MHTPAPLEEKHISGLCGPAQGGDHGLVVRKALAFRGGHASGNGADLHPLGVCTVEELINEFNKVAGYKIDVQKINCISIHLQSENEISETISFTIA